MSGGADHLLQRGVGGRAVHEEPPPVAPHGGKMPPASSAGKRKVERNFAGFVLAGVGGAQADESLRDRESRRAALAPLAIQVRPADAPPEQDAEEGEADEAEGPRRGPRAIAPCRWRSTEGIVSSARISATNVKAVQPLRDQPEVLQGRDQGLHGREKEISNFGFRISDLTNSQFAIRNSQCPDSAPCSPLPAPVISSQIPWEAARWCSPENR